MPVTYMVPNGTLVINWPLDTDNQDTYELVHDPVQVPLYYMNVVIEYFQCTH